MTCNRKIGPYDCCSVVQGDCLELMREVPTIERSAIISDPPYGIGHRRGSCSDRGKGRTLGTEGIEGDFEPFNPEPFLRFKNVLLWGANFYARRLPEFGRWLIWDKQEHGGSGDFSEAEIAWHSQGRAIKFFRHMWLGVQRSSEIGEPRIHPMQKPVALMGWCIEQAGTPETIIDPYCGSGSTLCAAKKQGRHFLGMEISAEHYKEASDRIARIEAQPTLFEPKPEQMELA